MIPPAPSFVDFFAGSGMGLVKRFGIRGFEIGKSVPAWSNDICPKKAAIYRANHGDDHFHLGSIEQVRGPAAFQLANSGKPFKFPAWLRH